MKLLTMDIMKLLTTDIMKLLTMQFSLGSSYFLPLISEYPSQHIVLENTHPVFFPNSERLFFVSI
jgi:hypothetical protein